MHHLMRKGPTDKISNWYDSNWYGACWYDPIQYLISNSCFIHIIFMVLPKFDNGNDKYRMSKKSWPFLYTFSVL